MSEGEINQWASHQPVLAAALAATTGAVLECGVGYNSTEMLHAACAASGRQLYSLDGNAAWLDRFQGLAGPHHTLAHVADWDNPPIENRWYGVVFVDHDKAPRGPIVAAVRDMCALVVMHDSECHYCGYTEPLNGYDWVYTHKLTPAWTTIAGMGPRPAWVPEALPCGDWGVPAPYRG